MKNKIFKITVLSLLLAFAGMATYGCQELETVNVNSPDEARALQNPEDVEALIAGAYFSWFTAVFNGNPIESLETSADVLSYSWGNFGSRELSSEPRAAIPNQTSWRYRAFVNTPWFGLYGAISSANDGLRAIDGGLEIEELARARAFAKFNQGISHAMLAILFDQAFIFDETIDLETADLQLSDYNAVFAAAKTQLEEAISIMESNSFTLPGTWIIGTSYSSAELAQLTHTLLAKFMTMVPRDAAARSAVNWNEVLSHIDRGITEDFVMIDQEAEWWNSLPWYHSRASSTTWGRGDYKMIGPSDRSSGYQDWLSTPTSARDDFEMDTADLRIWDQTRDDSGNQNPGLYYDNRGAARFPPDRGTYHHSMYSNHRWPDYQASSGNGPMTIILAVEMDFLRAEALLHTGGSLQEVVDIINATRVVNGGLEAADVSDGAGSMSDTRAALKPASLWGMLKYEKAIETTLTFVATQFCDARGWGDLTGGTFTQLPIPAQELETLQLATYTFGGSGPGSAPKQHKDRVRLHSSEASGVH